MSEYSIFQVDAFADKIFRGNPAAVVPLADWLEGDVLQQIAMENNLSETAFFTRADDDDVDFHLRWFTPASEIDLCGHATLAAAHVLFTELDWYEAVVRFSTETAGILIVSRLEDGQLQLDFPARPATDIAPPEDLLEALSVRPDRVMLARDHMAIFETEAEVAAVTPDMEKLAAINKVGVIVTAPADQSGIDFVSRFFAPAQGIPEDPVTGSIHCTLIPYWAERLGKTNMQARQISARSGELQCEYLKEEKRVYIAGYAITYLKGHIFV
ncbi:MAG: PhzF family phenazine biosynthesis protein [Emcibacter sp.]|nr:PhzF family phenazine biosynthesis protein [Emcibacter sp.]